MIIVDEINLIKNQISSLDFDGVDFSESCKILTYKEFSSLDFIKRREILLINTSILSNQSFSQENVKSLLNTFFCVIFFTDSPDDFTQNDLSQNLFFLKNILGIFSFSLSQREKIILANQILFADQMIKEEKEFQQKLTHFSHEFDQILKKTDEEMLKIKKLHGMLMPRRFEEIKGINFFSKYLAGSSDGSEFCDVVQSQNKIYVIFVSSESYLMTSSLMGLLLKYKEKFNLDLFVGDVKSEIDTISRSKKRNLNSDVQIIEIDPFSLQVKALMDSEVCCFGQSSGQIFINGERLYQMEKGERIFVFSKGFMSNWNNRQIKNKLEVFLKTQSDILSPDLMTELFFSLKDESDEKFLQKDSMAMILEINRHGIQKV